MLVSFHNGPESLLPTNLVVGLSSLSQDAHMLHTIGSQHLKQNQDLIRRILEVKAVGKPPCVVQSQEKCPLPTSVRDMYPV